MANKQPLQQAASELIAFIGSTTHIAKRLFKARYKIPNTVRDSPNLSKLIKLEAEVAHLNNEVVDYPSRLLQTTKNIKGNIDHLAANSKSVTATQMRQLLATQFAPLQADAADRAAQRQQLVHTIKEFIKYKDVTMEEIIRISAIGKSKEEVKKTLDKTAAKKLDKLAASEKIEEQVIASTNKIRKNLDDLKNMNTKLLINEEALQKKLDNLYNDSLIAAQTTGVPMVKEVQKPTFPAR
jgi:vacuolar-type H+-ATPase subunit I/STV1